MVYSSFFTVQNSVMSTLVWLRQDLRLADNPALHYACSHAEQVWIVFIHDSTPTSTTQMGQASRVWLHASLLALSNQLAAKGVELILRQGEVESVLTQLLHETGATQIVWNRVYEPATRERDTQLKQALKPYCSVKSFNAALLREPWDALKPDGSPYKVFSPFWKAQLKQGLPDTILPTPSYIPQAMIHPPSLTLEQLGLLPRLGWHVALMAHWQVGEVAAQNALQRFLAEHSGRYSQARDYPAQMGTSRLSAHLHFGELSPRQIVAAATAHLNLYPEHEAEIAHFLREVGWREFAYHLLYYFPQTVTQPLDGRFKAFVWNECDPAILTRWQCGQTGIPIIDAGMRELWQTGWMHNRVRMLVASFLTKNLLIPWQVGEQWFRDTLVDADLANNVLGWQWTAGCGADAAPYFRIFNPVLQSQKFDPNGEYIRRWCPELHQRDAKAIHFPRQLGESLNGYPLPVVDLARSREVALTRFAGIKGGDNA